MGCRKTYFKTIEQAESRADYLNEKNKKRRIKNSEMRAYRCGSCDGFHLTHENESNFKFKVKCKKGEVKTYENHVIENKIKQLQQKLNNKENGNEINN